MTNVSDLQRRLHAAVRDIPDFPRPGIVFKDITPVLADPILFADVVAQMTRPFVARGITHVVAIESRGFIVGAPIALALGAALVPVRKPGKLPHETIRESYALEYGTDILEIHADACGTEAVAIVVDDLLATGGTAAAACRLVERAGGRVLGCAFLIELTALEGRETLRGREVQAVVGW